MSRQSARKVKLTSKFEEFSTSRLASIRLAAQPPPTPVTPATTTSPAIPSVPTTPAAPTTPAKLVQTPKPVASVKPPAPAKPPTPATPSTPTPHVLPKLTANGKIRGRPRKCWQKAETVVKPMSSTREELLRLREENLTLKSQLEQMSVDFEDLKRQSSYTGQTVPKIDFDDLKEKYQRDLLNAKRHEWCVVCLNASRYHCCWNTTYCSQKCQVADWYQRHIKSCERRKSIKTVNAAM